METFWFFRLRFRRAYDSAYDSDIRFSLGHKLSCDSDSDSVASENQPLTEQFTNSRLTVDSFILKREKLKYHRRFNKNLKLRKKKMKQLIF